jgi:acetyl esterase/lipase
MCMNFLRGIRFRILAAALILLALSACRVTDLVLWKPLEPSAGAYEVERIRDVPYYDGPQADLVRHRLDLFLPKGKTDYPVVVLVHGGAWMLGDNRCCGLYSTVGEYLASRGIGAVLPNYRLSPFVKHPEHIKDLARAFAWTKSHIAEHGGRADQLFLVGHSAGGHLVALLATDEKYLKAEGCRDTDIQGVIGISGVYRIPAGKTDVELGGTSPLAVRLDEMAPLRGASAQAGANPTSRSGLPVSLNVFHFPFGDDPQVRRDASPVHHVRPGLPPFLLMNAEKDLPILPAMAAEMHQALLKHGCESHHVTVENRNHNSILFKAIGPSDPAARAIVEFVRQTASRAKPPCVIRQQP